MFLSPQRFVTALPIARLDSLSYDPNAVPRGSL